MNTLNYTNTFARNAKRFSIIVLGAVLVFFACKGTQPIDPKIAEAQKAATDFRNAFGPAKTDPHNITTTFNDAFAEEAGKLGKNLNNMNVADSADVIDPLAVRFEPFGENANPDNMNVLKTKAVNVQALRAYYSKDK